MSVWLCFIWDEEINKKELVALFPLNRMKIDLYESLTLKYKETQMQALSYSLLRYRAVCYRCAIA